MLMLAQSGFAALDAVAPTPLADSPALSRYLFESPWLAVIAAAGLPMGTRFHQELFSMR
jgi:hypothetical protein